MLEGKSFEFVNVLSGPRKKRARQSVSSNHGDSPCNEEEEETSITSKKTSLSKGNVHCM